MSKIGKITTKTPESKRDNSVSQTRRTDFSKSTNSPVDQIFFLQRTIGNQAVQRLFKSGVIQAKLKIGQPNDIYEQEADRVAEQVMRMPEPRLQRQAEEEEEKEEETLQTKEIPGQTPEVSPDLESRINAIRGGGQPLPESVRAFFEPRFGYDFSQVRIHSNLEAAQTARALNAKAFTVGRDILFGAGQYTPATAAGRSLLAHELTHIAQQNDLEGFDRCGTQSMVSQDVQRCPLGIMLASRESTLRHRPVFSASPRSMEQKEKSIQMKLISTINGILQRQEKSKGEKSESRREKVLEFAEKRGVPSELGAKVLEIIEEQLNKGIMGPNKCVIASFERIQEACAELGGTKFPPSGAVVIFEMIWNSGVDSKYWEEQFHEKLVHYKGGGAAGAVYYAGLGYLVEWKNIWTDLQPGAVLQLWESRSAYEKVKYKKGEEPRGHSVIFVRYVEKAMTTLRRTDGTGTREYDHEAGMLIVEQYGEDILEKKTGRQVARFNLRWRYGVGANFYPLKKPPSEEAVQRMDNLQGSR